MTASSDQSKSMTFWEHLDELRIRLRRAVGAYVLAMFAAWYAREPVLAFLVYPFKKAWVQQNLPGEPMLHFAGPADGLMAYLQQSLFAALVFAGPIIFWELWAFIAPGLYKREKKSAVAFMLSSTVLFVAGAGFAWAVAFPVAFTYLLSMSGDLGSHGVAIQPTIMMIDYLGFIGRLLLVFGLIFEIPLVTLFLSVAGIVNYKQLWRFGRWFVLIAFTLGAVLTPPDVTSQFVMAIPMCFLYLLSIGLAYVFGKRPEPEGAKK